MGIPHLSSLHAVQARGAPYRHALILGKSVSVGSVILVGLGLAESSRDWSWPSKMVPALQLV